MSNMAEVNGTDHLVRHEKETKLNGYDNEGYHGQERFEDEEESASDDDRLRIVVTENGHRPETDGHPHLHNGHIHEETNGHSTTTVNGTAVIVLEDKGSNSNMEDCSNKGDSSQKPLDTRLHHYVPVDDVDRKILNGSDRTHVTIPEDAVISFTTGRVKVKKSASNNPSERESIPLETMLPSYEAEDKICGGLGEKAELEAELANHKNGLWSEGHNAYSNPEGPFSNSEKFNGTSKSSDEISLPVNNHRKCLRGEKLYFTDDHRKLCPGWRRVFLCGLLLIILAVALLLGVLAATGILLAESESKNIRYESGHSLPSIDSVSHAGHSLRPRPPKVPQKFAPPEDASHLPANETNGMVVDTVSPPPSLSVTSKVPLLNDSSHSQTIVPNALVGEFTIIDENFTEDLKDSTSHGYTSLATHLEAELRRIFKRNGGAFQDLRILSFSPGSIKVKFVTIWTSDRNIILSEKAVEIMKSYLRKKHNLLLAFPVDMNSIHFKDVFDECRVQKGGCSYHCIWDYNTLAKTCACKENMMLLDDGKTCGLKPTTTSTDLPTSKVTYRIPSTIQTTATEPILFNPESLETATKQFEDDFTTPMPKILVNGITTIMEFFNNLTATEKSGDVNETTTVIVNLLREIESSSENLNTTTKSITDEHITTAVAANTQTTENPKTSEITTTLPIPKDVSVIEKTDNHTILGESTTIENKNISYNLANLNGTTLSPGPVTVVTEKSFMKDKFSTDNEYSNPYTNNPIYIENLNETTTMQLTTVEPPTTQAGSETIMPEFSELLTMNSVSFEIMNEATMSDLHTTEPSTIEDVSTIGYHIQKETIQIYTLKDSADLITETNPVISSESENVTDHVVTTTEGALPTSPEKAILDSMTEPIFTTYTPKSSTVTEKYEKSMPVEITKYDTTMPIDMTKYDRTSTGMAKYDTTEPIKSDTVTEIPHITDKIIIADDFIHESTTNDSIIENVTELGTFNTEIKFPSPDIESLVTMPTVSTTSVPIVNETDLSETVATISSKPPVIPSFNRTPEVRSFDNFTEFHENGTFVPNIDLLSGDATFLESSTEVDAFLDNSSLSVPKLDNIITSSPSTTSISFTEHYVETAAPEIFSVEIENLKTAINNVSELTSHNTTMESEETTIPTFTEATLMSLNFSSGGSKILVSNETTIELNVTNPNSVSEFHRIKNEDDTVLFNDSVVFASSTTENYYVNESTIPEGTTETLLIEDFLPRNTSENSTFEVTTIISVNNSIIDNLDILNNNENSQAFPNTEIPLNLNNETAAMDFYETTLPSIKINSDITTVNYTDLLLDLEISNSTNNFFDTVIPSIISTAIEPMMNESGNVDFQTLIPPISKNNETIVLSEETIDNITVSIPSNFTDFNGTGEPFTLTTAQDFTFPTPMYFNESEMNITMEPASDADMLTTVEYGTVLAEDVLDTSFMHTIIPFEKSFDETNTTLAPEFNEFLENGTLTDEMGNFTTDNYENITNETTTNASTGIECRGDQFLCESLNKCINDTFMCDGIVDCPDGRDEYECKDTCHSNFMCTNTSVCIMNDARCDGIWDCENGTDEENCTPTECAKHEVMCSDGSKCIKPGDICDWNYDCLDRSDEVGCMERTTCESGGKFFCNDGLCIPWSLKCDGEFDCKEGEDEGNCTCLSDEFQCNDGKCLKSSSRCDGHQDCHDARDEMGCVNVDSEHIVSTYEPYSGTWGLLCAEDWNFDDGQYLCQELGFGHALNVESVRVSFNGTWMAMRRDNLTETSLWTERVSFVESCTSSLAAHVECQKFACGEYTGLLHRRKRDTISSSSSQWPFIGYASTFQSSRGCLSEILTPIWLITSAECLLSISKQPFNGSDWYVRTDIGRNIEVDQAQNHEVLRIISHSHSSKYRTLTIRDYDVALIRLKHALVFVSDKIGAICPPEEQVPPGITCFSGVLGTEKPRAPPPKSLAINSLALQIIDKENCNRVEHFNKTINQRMLCTQSSEGHTICDNDEGTPLMCLTGINKWFLAGMLTYQRFCDVYLKHPAVFSNLFSMRKFLDQVTGQKQYEIPYDSNVYIIIPPTTPSPTMPEITTMAMTTTQLSLFDTTYPTTLEFENVTENIFGILENINGTTIQNEELDREETFTTISPGEFTTEFPNTTEMYSNETIPIHYGMEYDIVNTTAEETEKSMDELSANKTHHYLITLHNDTYTGAEANITNVSIFDNSTELGNTTISSVLETDKFDLANIPMTFESLGDMNTTSEFINTDAESTTAQFMNIIGENATTELRTLENTTNLMNVENSTISLMNMENATDDFMKKGATIEPLKLDNDRRTEPSIPDSEIVTEVSHVDTLNINLNETRSDNLRFIMNETVPVSQPLILTLNDSIDSATFMPDLNNITEIIEPLISAFNISSEMHQPMLKMNETVYINQPMIHVINETTNGEIETLMAALPSEYFKNSSEMNTQSPKLDETTIANTTPLVEIATMPSTLGTNTELVTTSPVEHATESFEIVMDGEPDVDLAFSIFNDSDGIKFESLVSPETNHASEQNSSITAIYDNETLSLVAETTTRSNKYDLNSTVPSLFMTDNMYTDLVTEIPNSTEYSPLISDDAFKVPNTDSNSTGFLGLITDRAYRVLNTDSNSTEFSDLMTDNAYKVVNTDSNSTEFFPLMTDNKYENSTTEVSNSTQFSPVIYTNSENLTTKLPETNLTTHNSEVEILSEMNNGSFLSFDENTTLLSEITLNASVPDIEDFIMKTHLVSDKLTVIQNNSLELNNTECGFWDENSGIHNDSHNETYFMQWPALGFLQMVSEPKMCASVIVSSKFVLTSLNCLTFRDNQLDPDKWTYIGGLYHTNVSNGGTQNLSVSKIIPYPNQSRTQLFYEHDVAVVKLKDTIKVDNYSTNACVPQEDVKGQQKCFTTGWTKNITDDDYEKQFYSVPVSIVPVDECNNTANYNGMLLESLICGTHHDESIQACQMDLGAPLFCLNENKQWEIQGVLSFPGPCDMNQPTVYNSVAKLRKWIMETLTYENPQD